MAYWIAPNNDRTFRIGDAIAAQGGMADWRTEKFSVGDIVFIYKTKPELCVRYKMEVIETGIQFDEALNQEAFWTDMETYYGGITSKHVRLKLLEEYPAGKYSIGILREHGFRGTIQSVQTCPESVVDFLLGTSENDGDNEFEVDYPADDENLYEGALVQVMANKYERNKAARQKCIDLKGYKCIVCGRDFEETYGDVGKGFIHVHHLVPIASVGKEYKLDVANDLAPVCPNCHYMLHRRKPPYSIEELRLIMEKAAMNDTQEAAEPITINPFQNYHDGCVPLYNLKAACGCFEQNEEPDIEGWFDVRGHGFTPNPSRHFAVYAKGNSMYPKINDGDICVFERYQGGPREGYIVLTKCNGIDPDTGCEYTIKEYHSNKVVTEDGWYQESITLSPINKKYDDIHLDPDELYSTIGILKCVLSN